MYESTRIACDSRQTWFTTRKSKVSRQSTNLYHSQRPRFVENRGPKENIRSLKSIHEENERTNKKHHTRGLRCQGRNGINPSRCAVNPRQTKLFNPGRFYRSRVSNPRGAPGEKRPKKSWLANSESKPRTSERFLFISSKMEKQINLKLAL